MILRIWHGWTIPENADEYERLLTEEIFPDIAEKTPEGYLGYEVGRREGASDNDDRDEVEFVTVMRFDSEADVEALVGEDYEQAHIPDAARNLLERWEERVRHYELRDSSSY